MLGSYPRAPVENRRTSVRRVVTPSVWRDDALELLDQTRLPHEEHWLRCTTAEDVADAIRRLAVRGAPAIGVAAAYGVVLGVRGGASFSAVRELLAATRPTAVNLRWALDRMAAVASGGDDALLERAHAIAREQQEADARMAEHGVALIGPGERL